MVGGELGPPDWMYSDFRSWVGDSSTTTALSCFKNNLWLMPSNKVWAILGEFVEIPFCVMTTDWFLKRDLRSHTCQHYSGMEESSQRPSTPQFRPLSVSDNELMLMQILKITHPLVRISHWGGWRRRLGNVVLSGRVRELRPQTGRGSGGAPLSVGHGAPASCWGWTWRQIHC